jgi:hypothetical protein
MISLGRPSSEESKISELKARIKPGSIIHIFCDFINNPKIKYIAIVYIDFQKDASLVFVVNSEISPFIEHDAHLKQGQIKLAKVPNYTFLIHDSYINCVEVFDGLDLDFTIHHLLENPGEYKGELKSNEIDKIIAFVKTAQTIPNPDKDHIIKSLSCNKVS